MLEKNLKKGVKCVIVADNSSHGKEIGIVVTLERSCDRRFGMVGYCTKEFGGTWFALNDLEIYEQSIDNFDNLEEDLEDAINKVGDIKLKIAWLEETGNKVFNEDEFKVYKTLKLLENSELSIIEKSKLISKLIK